MNKKMLEQALEKIADFLPAYMDGVATREYLSVIHNAINQKQSKPLTDEQIEEIADGYLVDYRIPAGCAWNFARDIEAAHGIKE
jgi:phage-related baseplate assembly protein